MNALKEVLQDGHAGITSQFLAALSISSAAAQSSRVLWDGDRRWQKLSFFVIRIGKARLHASKY